MYDSQAASSSTINPQKVFIDSDELLAADPTAFFELDGTLDIPWPFDCDIDLDLNMDVDFSADSKLETFLGDPTGTGTKRTPLVTATLPVLNKEKDILTSLVGSAGVEQSRIVCFGYNPNVLGPKINTEHAEVIIKHALQSQSPFPLSQPHSSDQPQVQSFEQTLEADNELPHSDTNEFHGAGAWVTGTDDADEMKPIVPWAITRLSQTAPQTQGSSSSAQVPVPSHTCHDDHPLATTPRKRHKKNANTFMCPHSECAMRFDRNCDLNKHVKRKHGPGSHPCSDCRKAFHDKKDRDRHILSMHRSTDAGRKLLAEMADKARISVDDQAAYSTPLSELKSASQSVPWSAGYDQRKRWPCSQDVLSPRSYKLDSGASTSGLAGHCPDAEDWQAGLSAQWDLLLQRRRSQEIEKCHLCDSRFRNSDALRHHLAINHEEKPSIAVDDKEEIYACNTCSLGFRCHDDLQGHLFKRHGGVDRHSADYDVRLHGRRLSHYRPRMPSPPCDRDDCMRDLAMEPSERSSSRPRDSAAEEMAPTKCIFTYSSAPECFRSKRDWARHVDNLFQAPQEDSADEPFAKRRRRRESDALVERRQRDDINERVADLASLVPPHRLGEEKLRKHLEQPVSFEANQSSAQSDLFVSRADYLDHVVLKHLEDSPADSAPWTAEKVALQRVDAPRDNGADINFMSHSWSGDFDLESPEVSATNTFRGAEEFHAWQPKAVWPDIGKGAVLDPHPGPRPDTSQWPGSPSASPSDPWMPTILSLDGGGIRGYSSLLILRCLLARVRNLEALAQNMQVLDESESRDEIPHGEHLPYHHFDFMYGTSTGGLIATMLGRLRMNIPEALETYRSLRGGALLGDPGSGLALRPVRYRGELESLIREMLLQGSWSRAWIPQLLAFSEAETSRCISPSLLGYKRLNVENGLKNASLSIWECTRATSAAPSYFSNLLYGNSGIYQDGGVLFNNPSTLPSWSWQGSGSTPGLLLSIGTGRPNTPLCPYLDKLRAVLQSMKPFSPSPSPSLVKKSDLHVGTGWQSMRQIAKKRQGRLRIRLRLRLHVRGYQSEGKSGRWSTPLDLAKSQGKDSEEATRNVRSRHAAFHQR